MRWLGNWHNPRGLRSCTPGRAIPAPRRWSENVPGDVNDLKAIEKFVKNNAIGLVVIGPEEPLALGLADRILALGVKVFGPNQAAAQIEADKWFAKEIMRQQSIPTAEARSFIDPDAADEYIKIRNGPCVIKAAGLAKGKGVTICHRAADALATIDLVMRKKAFGSAGERVVIEELMKGPECSIPGLRRSPKYLSAGTQPGPQSRR